jgi:branched-chain amino acid transport system ATP-binding protein
VVTEAAALAVRDVVKNYGSLAVLDGVSFEIAAGEVTGVVGPNGAGKTTLIDIVAGLQRCDRGAVVLNGTVITGLAPPKRSRMGLARTFQVPRPFGDLTVFENALVGSVRAAGLRGLSAYGAASNALEVTGMLRQANTQSGSLRLLDRKRLELARALAMRPAVLLLDEVAAGLTEPETAELIETIRRVRDQGTTVIWVEHIIRALVQVATRLICLAGGRIIADGPPGDVLASSEVREAYLGGYFGAGPGQDPRQDAAGPRQGPGRPDGTHPGQRADGP